MLDATTIVFRLLFIGSAVFAAIFILFAAGVL